MRRIINNNDINDDKVDNNTNYRNICNDNENDNDVDGVELTYMRKYKYMKYMYQWVFSYI